MTSSKQNFQNLREASSQIFDKINWSKFNQNWPNSVKMKGCDRHTDTHIHTETHRQGLFRTNI